MTDLRRARWALVAALALVVPSQEAGHAQQRGNDDKRPSLSLRATPPVGFSPLRVRAVVEVRGGSDDFADFYCAGVEWDWGDDEVSEQSSDCEPHEPGKSTIQRRFTAEHVFRRSGEYRIVFRLKKGTRQVAAANASITVRGASGEDLGR